MYLTIKHSIFLSYVNIIDEISKMQSNLCIMENINHNIKYNYEPMN